MLKLFYTLYFVAGRGGRRSGVGRGGRRSTTVPTQVVTPNINNRINTSPTTIINTSPVTPTEPAQILLSLSGNNLSNSALQTTSRNVRISPNSRMGKILSTNNLDTQNYVRNGSFTSEDIKPRINFEPRRRGRKKQNGIGLGRGKIKDLDSRIAVENLKKEMDDFQRNDSSFRSVDSKLNLFNNNVNNTDKSPLLASLLSKAEALAGKAKIKSEIDNLNDITSQSTTGDQETLLYQFDGESSGVSKYIDALKEAGLPTDVPVLIDNGDGNYITLTEDLLMNVLGSNESFQFQVTEATMEQEDVSEGVVLQDGSIMMTGKPVKQNANGPIVTIGKDCNGIKGKKAMLQKTVSKPKPFVVKEMQATKFDDEIIPDKKVVKSTKSVEDLINDALLESLKTSKETEVDPDAVVLFEVTDDSKVTKYVVSSKEVNTLKLLNEQIMQKRNVKGDKVPAPTVGVIGENTKVAEVKLSAGSNFKKSIVSQVLEYVHKMDENVQNADQNNFKEVKESDMPEMNIQGLERQSQLVELEFIDGNGEKIEGYQVEGTILSDKQIEVLNDDQSKDTDVMGLLDMVCEDASNENIENDIVQDVLNVEQLDEENHEKEIIDSTEQKVEVDFTLDESTKDDGDFDSHDLDLKDNSSKILQHEDTEVSMDGECNMSVEQALEAMMGGDNHSVEVEKDEVTEETIVKSVESQDQDTDNLRIVLSQENDYTEKEILDEQGTFQFVYTDQKLDERTESEVVIMEPTEELILSSFNNEEEKLDMLEETVKEQEEVPDECIETSIISPTKDVPFAVGLLPLKTALEQIQMQNDHQPMKTRSGVPVLKLESIKRRNSEDQCLVDVPEKRLRNIEVQEDLPEHLLVGMEEECIATS